MFNPKFLETPREFTVNGFLTFDRGSIEMVAENNKTHELVSLETAAGKKCDVVATSWGFYLGPSVNSRLKNEGFKSALMLNEGNQLYVVAVDNDQLDQFAIYLSSNKSKVICWLDEWLKAENIHSPHE